MRLAFLPIVDNEFRLVRKATSGCKFCFKLAPVIRKLGGVTRACGVLLDAIEGLDLGEFRYKKSLSLVT